MRIFQPILRQIVIYNNSMLKRSINDFFSKSPQASKKARTEPSQIDEKPAPENGSGSPSQHDTYPHPINSLPTSILTNLDEEFYDGKLINDKLDLDLLHYQPFLSKDIAKNVYLFLRKELPFYRVCYKIKRGTFETQINTPRFTTVFGVDSHSKFDEEGKVIDAKTGKPVEAKRYSWKPRPIPQCLEVLKNKVERESGFEFNFVLVNYYASPTDSISYHSDDERFLGPNPTIASLSLGTTRDFLMKHKDDKTINIKLPLSSGEMVIMKGPTQKMWLHSIPKRTANKVDNTWTCGGRINITFRRAVMMGGTGNYYTYNVGKGPVYRWDEGKKKMELMEGQELENEKESGDKAVDAMQDDSNVKREEGVNQVKKETVELEGKDADNVEHAIEETKSKIAT